MWVVSKNESNCLSENKMLSTLIWRHVSLLYVVQSNILWRTILLSYHYRCNVVFTYYRFPVSFLLYIATQTLKEHYHIFAHAREFDFRTGGQEFKDAGIDIELSEIRLHRPQSTLALP